jgi:small-conductance mechanosensitive channel
VKFIHRTLDRVEVPRVPVPVSPDFRVAIGTALAAVAGLVVSTQGNPSHHAAEHKQVLAYAGAVAFLGFGVLCVRSLAGEISRVLGGRTGPRHAGIVRWLILLIGYAIIAFTFLGLIQVKAIHQLLVGGALTGIVLGIAAQQSLGNLFAGIVLLLARPFNVGDRIRIKSGALGGELVGEVTGMGLTYVTLLTGDGPLSLPNAAMLAAGIGPAATAAPTDGDADADADAVTRRLPVATAEAPGDQNTQRMAGFPPGA